VRHLPLIERILQGLMLVCSVSALVLLGQAALVPILYIMCVLAVAVVGVAFLLQHRERRAGQHVRR
jgi:hypothetical protein